MMTKARPTIPSQVHSAANETGVKTEGGKGESKDPKRPSSYLESLQMRRHMALVFLRVLLALPGPVFLAFSIQQYFDGIGSFRSLVQGHIGLAFAVAGMFATAPLWLFSLLLAQIHHTVDFDKPESLHGRRVWTPVRAFECALFWLTAFAYILLYSQDRVFYVWAVLGLQPIVALALYSITRVVRAIINDQGSSYHSFLLSQGWRVFVNAIFCACVMLYALSAMSRIPIDALSIVAFSELSFSGIACSDESAFLNAFGASGANASCPAKPHCGYRTYEELCQAVQYSTMARGLSIDLELIPLFVAISWLVVSLFLLGTGRLRTDNGYSHLFSRHMIVGMLLCLVQLMNMIFSCMRLLLIVPRLQSPRQAAYFDREDSMMEELPLFCYSSDCIGIHLWGTVCLHALIAVVFNFDFLAKYASQLGGNAERELQKAIDDLKNPENPAEEKWEEHAPFFYFLPTEYVCKCAEKSLPRMQTLRDKNMLKKMKIPLVDAFKQAEKEAFLAKEKAAAKKAAAKPADNAEEALLKAGKEAGDITVLEFLMELKKLRNNHDAAEANREPKEAAAAEVAPEKAAAEKLAEEKAAAEKATNGIETGQIKNILFVSHRWEEFGRPDVNGVQLQAIQEYLHDHPDIKWVWFDYSSMPQGDDRTPKEKAEFQLMLKCSNDLYLTAQVLILLDGSYASRFWTLTEAWCSMQTATPEGLRPATEAERRYTISCIHNADVEHDAKGLVSKVSTRTPEAMYEILASPDVNVTNAKDKKNMLPVIQKTNEHVIETFQKLVARSLSASEADDSECE